MKKTKRILSLVLALVMALSTMSLSAMAAEFDAGVSDNYYTVISNKEYALAPGATETEMVVNNTDGTDRKVVHVIEVDPTEETLEIMPGYYGIDQLNPEDLAGDSAIWKAEQLTKTVAYYESMGYNVVGAMNTALAYDSNAPYGYMVWDGVVLGTPEIHKGAQTYLAINWDGSCELRSMATPLTGNEKTAISANFGWLVKDGALTSTSVERTSSDASRSMIGIKADGTLVFCQVDGRNAPVSTGLSNYEMGEMMLSLGCVNAVNCDGGGSSTFITQREGETEDVMRSVPSDGSERPTINSVIIATTAVPTGIFHHAVVSADYDFIAPSASMAMVASGVDTNGYPVAVPGDVIWQLSDTSMGTIDSNGVFTAGSATGTVTVQMVYGGAVVGEKVLNIVHPDNFAFSAEDTVLPYGKSAELELVTAYGADNWAVCIDGAYSLALSDEAAAALNGNVLTATSDESVAGVVVTATYLPDTTKTATIDVAFGKGSEILFDFENGEHELFLGVDEMYDWAAEVGAAAPIQSNGNYSDDADSTTFLATAENGQVKHGDHALGVTLDYTDAQFASWSYNMFFYTGEPYVLRDVANGQNATTLGMWVYIPEGAAGMAMQMTVYKGASAASVSGTQLHFYFTNASGTKKNLNSCSEADIPESRWVYATADLTGSDYVSLVDPMGTAYGREPCFIRFYVKPTQPANLTFYFDDFTLDYSSAVDDRVLPTISDVTYATGDTAVTLEEGVAVSGSEFTFTANVADNAGLNASTGVILVDGTAVNTTVSGSVMSSDSVKLNPGVHTVSFEIQDKLGNLAKVTRTFTVSGDAVVTLSGHNDSGAAAEYDSVYYADINVADIAAIDSVTTTIYLQTANTWEPQGIEVAEGFTAEYSLDSIANELTVTVTRTGETSLTGEQTLVSLPIRVWSWNGSNHVTDTAIAPATQFATGNCPIVTIYAEVVYGAVTTTDGTTAPFGGNHSHTTNLNDNVNPWHYHDSELTNMADVAATCTTAGYTGRTYCETCQSVVDWGTTVEALGHNHVVSGDALVCERCSDTITGTGLVTVGGKLYYLIADKLATGWQNIDGGWAYIDATTKIVCTGEFTVNGLTYTADENGTVIKGAWHTDTNGTKYSYGPAFYTREWAEIDGATYYFGTDSYVYTGLRFIVVNRNNIKEGYRVYRFADDGKLEDEMLDANGIITSEVDGMFYVENGTSVYGGLMLIDGDYYYARTSGQLVTDRTYWITKTNDLLPADNYTFGSDGKMIDPPVTEEPDQGGDSGETETPVEPEVKNGICADENGTLYYYVDGVKTYGGLLYIDGHYYYARTSGQIVVDRSYWITKNNDLLPVDNYTFGSDGKMVNPPVTEEPDQGGDSGEPETPVVPEVKNGICADENGTLYYYVDGVKTYGGLLYIDGHYYYARTSGQIVVDRSYWITKTNDLLPAANYTFGSDGKMVDPPVVE